MTVHVAIRVHTTVDIVVPEILVACVETVVVNVDDIAHVVVLVGVILKFKPVVADAVVVETAFMVLFFLVETERKI